MPTIIVYWSPGRTPQQKQRVIAEMTQTLVEHGGARLEDVLIIFQDIQVGDAGRAGKVLGSKETTTPASETPPNEQLG